MASFTDDIAHFNPYIEQIPVSDYVNVGLQLQSRYNEGVARSQNMIDSVAGLEVAGDANRQYLRDKVTDLEGKVAKIAGSDFAKNSVQSQVGALAGHIARDPVVQAGMQSAIRIKQYQDAWKDMEKNHPDQFSQKNKEYFDQYVNDYLKQSQAKAGLVYNGPTDATPYVDYYSKLDKELKSLDPTISTSIAANGQFQYRIDKSSIVSQDKILGVVNSVLASDPRIQQQMQIDSWHAYRSFDEKGMFGHIQDAFGSLIDAHKNNATYWQGVIKNNPNDYDAINMAQKKILDANTQITNLAKNRDNYLQAINDGKLDQVKQSVFNDSIRQGLILKYEKNNVESDLKSNENAIQGMRFHFDERRDWLEYVKAGIDPSTGKPLTPDNPLYTGYINANIKEFKEKNKKGTSEENLQPISMAGVVGDKYTESLHNQKIAQVEANMSELTTKFRQLKGKDFANNDQAWNTYLNTQEAKYQQGDPGIDPDYALYRKKLQYDKALHDTYVNNAMDIYNSATASHNLDNALDNWTTFKNVEKINPNGTKSRVDMVVTKDVLKAALDVRNQVYSEPSKTGWTQGQFVYGTIPLANEEAKTQADFMRLSEKYKNDPNYLQIVSLAMSPQLHDISQKNFGILKERAKQVEKGFADYGSTTSYRGLPFDGKPEYINYAKRIVATAVGEQQQTENQGGKEGLKEVNAEEVNPLAYYNDDLGRVHVRYQVGKSDKQYDVVVPDKENILGNPDPYQPIARMIELDGNHTTPVDVKQALSTDNGKIKYVIRKNLLSGDYEGRFYYKGTLYTIPSWSTDGNSYTAPNIGSFVERFENLSKLPEDQLQGLIKNNFGN